ncbi:MAG: HD domain-containing protein [Candidatus Portnoybacteria bacterium]|nr:HD domain-containing protein [Candidatus Portnoybacteria bacterium]
MKIPKEINLILEKLEKSGHQAYIVGGCVRDFLREVNPNDWDVTTNAKPKEIKKIFPKSFYENKFGTVTVLTDSSDESLSEVEITTYRVEGRYIDKRHPDKVEFAENVEDDLARRDFTINAMAMNDEEIIDPFDGQKDLEKKLIRAVGYADDRFNEDALRMLRAVRFSCVLDFSIERKTYSAIEKNAKWIDAISKERIRDEFVKIIDCDKAADGVDLLQKLGLLKYIIPELEKGVGVSQNRHHIYDIYEHSIRSLRAAAEKEFSLEVRMAALLHDIGKPETKEGEGPDSTFYNHDIVGARFAEKILKRLKFSNKLIDKVVLLVKNHMFVSDPERLTEAGARRLIKRAGKENIPDLINLRISDRLGMGRPKARPYRLRKVEYLIDKVSQDPVSVGMLKISGDEVMNILGISPGPKVGAILDVLLSEVIEDPGKNKKRILKKRIKELDKENLSGLRKMAREKIREKKEEEDLKIKEKYWIK